MLVELNVYKFTSFCYGHSHHTYRTSFAYLHPYLEYVAPLGDRLVFVVRRFETISMIVDSYLQLERKDAHTLVSNYWSGSSYCNVLLSVAILKDHQHM